MMDKLPPKYRKWLEKGLENYRRGHEVALVFEHMGKRYEGRDLKDLEVSDEAVSFTYGDEKKSFALADLRRVRRLRSRRFLFIFSAFSGRSTILGVLGSEKEEKSKAKKSESKDEDKPKKATKKTKKSTKKEE